VGGFSQGSCLCYDIGLSFEYLLGGITCFCGVPFSHTKINQNNRKNLNIFAVFGCQDHEFPVNFAMKQIKTFIGDNKNLVVKKYEPYGHNIYDDELKGVKKMDSYQYNCTECTSLIEIISLNNTLNEIEFRCLNNSHRIKKPLNDYLDIMRNYKYAASMKTECECAGHNKSKYEYYCLNCDKHLCKLCLESKEHLYHIKFNIMAEISLTKEEFIINK